MKETKRMKQVAELIRRHFGSVLFQEGRYIYGDALVTVTNVKMTADLGLAKIYLSVYNTENKQEVMLMMKENVHRLRQSLSQRIKRHIRRIPNINFYIDDTVDEMYRVDALFDKIHAERKANQSEEE